MCLIFNDKRYAFGFQFRVACTCLFEMIEQNLLTAYLRMRKITSKKSFLNFSSLLVVVSLTDHLLLFSRRFSCSVDMDDWIHLLLIVLNC